MRNTLFITLICLIGFCISTTAQNNPNCPDGTYFPLDFSNNVHLINGPEVTTGTPPEVPPGAGKDRTIYWVHGLEGSKESWAEAQDATDHGALIPPGNDIFPKRRTVGHLLDYVETSLEAAADNLNDNITEIHGVANPGDYSQDFIIAHSQGGVVSRYADMLMDLDPSSNWERRYYGVVTFDSPHSGAQIINSRDEGLISQMGADACNSVLTGPIADIFDSSSLITFFVDPAGIYNTLDKICDGVGYTVLPYMLAGLTAGSTQGYKVGAPQLGEINAFGNPSIHQGAVIGVEYTPGENPANPKQLLWRTMYSYSNSSNGPHFSNNEDDKWVNEANELRIKYQEKYEEAQEKVEFWESLGYPQTCWHYLFIPGSGPELYALCLAGNQQYEHRVEIRDALLKAIDWLDDSDDQWKVIIGALTFPIPSLGTCNCINTGQHPHVSEEYDNVPKDECTGYNTATYKCHWTPNPIEPVYKESDGIVLRESQEAWVGPLYKMKYTNHFQARNSRETALALLALYDGTGVNSDFWFKTDQK